MGRPRSGGSLLLCLGLAAVGVLAVSGTARATRSIFSQPWSDATDDYALDAIGRQVTAKGPLRCPEERLVRYRGGKIAYARAVRVDRAFQERLELFEDVVTQTATQFYGRAPRRLRHLGTFACRRIRSYPTFLSEHALGNAIDIEAFEFGPAPRAKRAGLAPEVRRAFQITILKHWDPEGTHLHARFLRTLAQRLVERRDVFRVLLGPGYPGHANHFHFDMGPYRMVEI